MKVLKGKKESREGRLLKGLIYYNFWENGFLTYTELERIFKALDIRLWDKS